MLISVLSSLKTLVKENLNGKPNDKVTYDSAVASDTTARTNLRKSHQETASNNIVVTKTSTLKPKSQKMNRKTSNPSGLPKTTVAAIAAAVTSEADVCSLSDEDDSLEREAAFSSPMKKISEVSNTVSHLRSSLLQLLISLHYIRLRSRLSIQRIVSLLKLRQNSWVL